MRELRIVLVGTGLLAAMTGCEDVDSDAVMTSGMYADIVAVATGDGSTKIDAVLRVGGNTSTTYVQLTGDDKLMASQGEESQQMVHQSLGDYHEYTTQFDVDAGETEFHVAFERTADVGAPDSSMALPEPFTLGAVADFSRAEGITVTWEPSGTADLMQVGVIGSCVFDADWDVDGDPGTYTFGAGEIELVSDTVEESCDVTITVQRFRNGTVDAGFGEGGWVRGMQRRSAEVVCNP